MAAPAIKLTTKCAHWGWDDHRYFGHSVFNELAGSESMTSITALSILGRRLSRECCDVLDDIVCTSTLADPRIWPLKLTRLIAAFGGIMPATAAGLLVQEGARIGPWTLGASAQVLIELHGDIAGREHDTDLVLSVVQRYLRARGMIAGFGTPYRHADERLRAFRERMKMRGRDQLPYWRLMEAVTCAARQLRRSEPNISIAVAAALLDMGVSHTKVSPLVTALCQHMFFANAVEGAHQAPAILRELRAEYVRYVGRPPRSSPRSTRPVSMTRYHEWDTG